LPSLRTAEYCLHGNEGNKTTKHNTALSPPRARTHKSGVCNRKEWARAAQRGEEISASPLTAPGGGSPANPTAAAGKAKQPRALPSFLFFMAMPLQSIWGAQGWDIYVFTAYKTRVSELLGSLPLICSTYISSF
uniref:Uncharacterized protein n=1 Tax=Athene cunicularia TaxID=194338 RepID=A0A663M0B9_ATHCN